MMIPIEKEPIMEHLKELGHNPQFQKETGQVYIIVKPKDHELPLFFKFEQDKSSLQLVLFLPLKIKASHEGDLGRYLHFLNKEIDLPGFGMDEGMGVVFYRGTLFGEKGKFNVEHFDRLVESIPGLSNLFLPPIALLANGAAPLEIVKERTIELMKKMAEGAGSK